jgi:uncharacterized membrane protein
MQGIKRKIVYITLYELLAISFATLGLALMSGQGMVHSGALAVITSAIAVVWNLAFNTAFEWWEARQPRKGRSLGRRIQHALGFEGGLVLLLVPTIAWWLEIGLLHALVIDLGLIVFFLIYTFVFNWGFDRVFGLPASAMPVRVMESAPASVLARK